METSGEDRSEAASFGGFSRAGGDGRIAGLVSKDIISDNFSSLSLLQVTKHESSFCSRGGRDSRSLVVCIRGSNPLQSKQVNFHSLKISELHSQGLGMSATSGKRTLNISTQSSLSFSCRNSSSSMKVPPSPIAAISEAFVDSMSFIAFGRL